MRASHAGFMFLCLALAPPALAGPGDQAAPVDWRNVACNAASLQAFSRAPNTRPLVRVDGAGYTVYISGDIPDSLVCRFSAVFTETFEFFLTALNRDLASGPPPEFPAVLELAS